MRSGVVKGGEGLSSERESFKGYSLVCLHDLDIRYYHHPKLVLTQKMADSDPRVAVISSVAGTEKK